MNVLKDFLVDWLAWIDRGAPDGKPYWRDAGLCSSCQHRYKVRPGGYDVYAVMLRLHNGRAYPFGGDMYCTNPKRQAWARQYVKDHSDD